MRMWLAALLLAAAGRAVPVPLVQAREMESSSGLFPAGYDQSRDSFRKEVSALSAKLGGDFQPFAVPNGDGDDLTIDHALFGRGGDRLLVLQSGIHGAEAAAGAAVQMLFLREHLDQLLAAGVDVYVIHALNPWGFKHGRRTDEHNVNLNRNFSIDGEIYRTPSPNYTKYRYLFEPRQSVDSDWADSLAGDAKFLVELASNGFSSRDLVDGMDNGQYQFPEGLNYGGSEPAIQAEFFRAGLKTLLARPYKKVLFLDFHTGLGEAGTLAVIKGQKPSPALMQELSSMLAGQSGIEIRSADSPGFFATYGDVIDYVPLLAPDPDRVLAVTMEYGTLGTDTLSQLKSAQRLILENQAWFHGCSSPAVSAAVKRNFADLFNPTDPEWRRKVILAANRVFTLLAEKF
jgi:predicted deacylase